MEALLVLVTDGIVPRPRRNSPWRRHAARIGMLLFSMYSRPNPSNMITTARCGARWANAGPERSAALEARNSRRERQKVLISSPPYRCSQNIAERQAACAVANRAQDFILPYT